MKKQSDYKQASYYLLLGLNELEDTKSLRYYDIYYNIGYMYCLMGNYEESQRCMQYILDYCQDSKLISSGKLLKARILVDLRKNKEAQMIYEELINHPLEIQHLIYAVCNLAKCYVSDKHYEKVLLYAKQSLDYALGDYQYAVIQLLISEIYKEVGAYNDAIRYCELAKEGILQSSVLIHVKE